MQSKKKTTIAHLFITLVLLFAAVGGWAKAGQASEVSPLKVALLPIVDALPYYVAEEMGYFESEGVAVKVIPVASALDRDQLMQAGAIDGMLNEMTSTAMFNRQSIKVKIIASCRASKSGYPLFRVLSAPGSGIKAVEGLAGIPIGVSKSTIIEYVTDRLLSRQGLKSEEIVKQSVPAIPERYQLLMNGRLKAVTLPDPLAASAMASGANLITDDSRYPRISVSVLSFSMKAMQAKGEDIRRFLTAWNRAAEAINADPDSLRGLFLKKIRVPQNVRTSYAIPPFQIRQIPDEDQWQDVMSWMTGKGLLKTPLSYSESVAADFQ